MKQATTMKDGLVNGLRALYETESRLSISISHDMNVTDVLPVKAEFVVYLSGVRRNIKAIEQIFSLLNECILLPAVPDSLDSLAHSFLINQWHCSGQTILSLIEPLQETIERKVNLYESAQAIARKLNQQRIALMLRDILQFEHQTHLILDEVVAHQRQPIAS